MKAIEIENTKNFMARLLGTEVFDDFLLEEATIKTFNTFHIDGRLIPDYFDDFEFGYEFSQWRDVRPLCFNLIKGKQLPVSCHFLLLLKPEKIEEILKEGGCAVSRELIGSFNLNIKYSAGKVTLISATAMKTFMMDQSPDRLWDEYAENFAKKYLG